MLKKNGKSNSMIPIKVGIISPVRNVSACKNIYDATTQKYVPKRLFPSFTEDSNKVHKLEISVKTEEPIRQMQTRNAPAKACTEIKRIPFLENNLYTNSTVRNVDLSSLRCKLSYSSLQNERIVKEKNKITSRIVQHLTNQYDRMKLRQKSYLV